MKIDKYYYLVNGYSCMDECIVLYNGTMIGSAGCAWCKNNKGIARFVF